MKTSRLLRFTIIILGMLLGNTVLAQGFSFADFSGPYAWVYNGSISVQDPSTGQLQLIPTASVGQIVSTGTDSDGDGYGEATVSSVTMNIGGLIVLEFASTAPGSLNYSVDSTTGVGIATVPVVLTQQPDFPLGVNVLPPGINASDFTGTATFSFASVVEADGTLNVVGTHFTTVNSSGETTRIPTIGRGTLKPQE